jgi:hypothetical protein
MKGTISDDLRAILNDNEGRKQLRRLLLHRKEGQVKVGGVTYNVATKSDSIKSLKSSGDRGSNIARSAKRAR